MTDHRKRLTKIVRAGLYLLIYFEVAFVLFGVFSDRTLWVECQAGVWETNVVGDAGGWAFLVEQRKHHDLKLEVTACRTEDMFDPGFETWIDTYEKGKHWDWSGFGLWYGTEWSPYGVYGVRHQLLLLLLVMMLMATYRKQITRRLRPQAR